MDFQICRYNVEKFVIRIDKWHRPGINTFIGIRQICSVHQIPLLLLISRGGHNGNMALWIADTLDMLVVHALGYSKLPPE